MTDFFRGGFRYGVHKLFTDLFATTVLRKNLIHGFSSIRDVLVLFRDVDRQRRRIIYLRRFPSSQNRIGHGLVKPGFQFTEALDLRYGSKMNLSIRFALKNDHDPGFSFIQGYRLV